MLYDMFSAGYSSNSEIESISRFNVRFLVYRPISMVLGVLTILGGVKCNPVPETVTSATLTKVRYVGVIQQGGVDTCMGTFLTRRFLGTSCRCIGDTDPNTGDFVRLKPTDFQVRTWGVGPVETKRAEQFYYYELCGVEANKILLDLGLVKTSEFSAGAVTPIGLPNASVFRFYEYIYVSTVKQTLCVSASLNKTISEPGETVLVQLKEPKFCQFRPVCNTHEDILKGDCDLPTLKTNHICGLADTICSVTSGAPLVCHGMLIGINAGAKNCESVINPTLFLRMDFTMTWIQSIVC